MTKTRRIFTISIIYSAASEDSLNVPHFSKEDRLLDLQFKTESEPLILTLDNHHSHLIRLRFHEKTSMAKTKFEHETTKQRSNH